MLRLVSRMTKLTELLEELCPDGVEYDALSEHVVTNLGGGTPSKSNPEYWGGGIPWASVGDVNSAGEQLHSTRANITELGLNNSSTKLVPAGNLIVALKISPGATVINTVDVAINQDLRGLLLDNELDPKFLMHYLRTQKFSVHGTIVKSITNKSLMSVLVPIPPLEVQQEIVRVLDAFTALEQSLVSELELRKKQFDSVRRSVISDSQAAEKKVLRLREAESEGIVTLGRGKVISKKDIAANPGDYPVYSSSGAGNGEFGRYGNYMFDDERISWSVDGGGRLFYRPVHRYSVTNVSGWMTVNISDLQVKYLYYVLLSQWENESFDYTRKAHPSVIREVYAFSIPAIEIQDEVVSKLDSLESLIQSIEQEINLRRQQYEFYRDELLSFAPKED